MGVRACAVWMCACAHLCRVDVCVCAPLPCGCVHARARAVWMCVCMPVCLCMCCCCMRLWVCARALVVVWHARITYARVGEHAQVHLCTYICERARAHSVGVSMRVSTCARVGGCMWVCACGCVRVSMCVRL